ncbi:heavy metal translocating P-type ATPase [Massiliimalia massiliensis]|nr:heavy metal translocating P-type ATPase [Massiliimalia massiliensis]
MSKHCRDGCCASCEAGHEHAHHDHSGNGHSHEHDGCGCGCSHGHDHSAGEMKTTLIRAGIILLLGAGGMLLPVPELVSFFLYLAALLVIGYDIVIDAVKNLFQGHMLDENFLMSLAAIGAFCVGEYLEGVAVMLLFQVGEMFQSYAIGKSRKSISSLMEIRPDFARVKRQGVLQTVPPEEVALQETIVVQPGERIPLDGVVREGSSMADLSALTGESVPQRLRPGENAMSGSINLDGVLEIEVSKEYGDSTVARILNLVENASQKKARSEQFITRFARVYTPIVVALAVLLAVVPSLITGVWSVWVYRALSFLVISCPCALVISVPLSFFGGIGGASRRGILVKGSNNLEALSRVETVALDKTGTLTHGVFRVNHIKPETVSEEELLRVCAAAEQFSNHPISRSVLEAYRHQPEKIDSADYEEIAGRGIRTQLDGKTVLVGNAKLMKENGVVYREAKEMGTVVYVAREQKFLGYLVISDELKADAALAVSRLRAAGAERIIMLTGDADAPGQAVARKLGLDEAYTQLLPDDKLNRIEQLQKEKNPCKTVLFAGDGINDAPVLMAADVGAAMGGLGSDAAIEAADVVIMTDEPSKLAEAVMISRRTLRIVKQNIAFALGVKALVLILAAFGVSTMWEAVFADVGVCLLAVLNATRALRAPKQSDDVKQDAKIVEDCAG